MNFMNEFFPLMQVSFSLMLLSGFVSVGFTILILLILRPFFLWYFRINERTALLAEIRNLIGTQGFAGESDRGNAVLDLDRTWNREQQFGMKAEAGLEPNHSLNAEIQSQSDPAKPNSAVQWNIDKPMQAPSDKRWQPPKTPK